MTPRKKLRILPLKPGENAAEAALRATLLGKRQKPVILKENIEELKNEAIQIRKIERETPRLPG